MITDNEREKICEEVILMYFNVTVSAFSWGGGVREEVGRRQYILNEDTCEAGLDLQA
jgi:hypothetical protein